MTTGAFSGKRPPGRAGRLALPLSLAFSSLAGLAAAQQWTQLATAGGRITALAAAPTDPATAYAGAFAGGLFRSQDAGASWSRAAITAIARDTVNDVAVDPGNPLVAYAGTTSRGVFRSGDGGGTWIAVNTGIPAANGRMTEIVALAVDPGASAVVLAGGRNVFVSGAPDLLLSTNAGGSWAPVIAPELAGVAINDVAAAPGVFLAASDRLGVWFSRDGGVTWSHLGDDAVDFISVESVAVDTTTAPFGVLAATNDGLFAIALPAASPGGVGLPALRPFSATWSRLGARDLTMRYMRCALVPSTRESGPQPTPSAGVQRASDTPPLYYVGTVTNGVWVSGDGGDAWSPANDGLAPVEVDELAQIPGPGPSLLAGADGAGVWRSEDGGARWRLSNAGLTAASVDAIAVDPASPATLYAGTEGGGVLKTVDGGATWGSVGFATLVHNAFDPWVSVLAVDPNATSTIYAVTGDGFFRSTDGGATWQRFPLPGGFYPRTLLVTGGAATTVWLGGTPGVLRSTTGGASWTKPDPAFTQSVQALAVSRTSPQTMVAGTLSNGVWKTVNEGTSWGDVNNDGGTGFLKFGNVRAVAVDPTSADVAYACVDGRAVWKTANGGTSWENQKEGLFDAVNFVYASLSSIAINPAHPNTLFAGASGDSAYGTTYSGVYRSNDGGAHWAKFGNGLEGLSIAAMILDPTNNNRLYAGGQGAGVFRYGPAATRTFEIRDRLRRGQ